MPRYLLLHPYHNKGWKLQEGRTFCLFCSLIYSLYLGQSLSHSKNSVNIWSIIEWLSEWNNSGKMVRSIRKIYSPKKYLMSDYYRHRSIWTYILSNLYDLRHQNSRFKGRCLWVYNWNTDGWREIKSLKTSGFVCCGKCQAASKESTKTNFVISLHCSVNWGRVWFDSMALCHFIQFYWKLPWNLTAVELVARV